MSGWGLYEARVRPSEGQANILNDDTGSDRAVSSSMVQTHVEGNTAMDGNMFPHTTQHNSGRNIKVTIHLRSMDVSQHGHGHT